MGGALTETMGILNEPTMMTRWGRVRVSFQTTWVVSSKGKHVDVGKDAARI